MTEQVIYGDTLFLVNAGMDFLALFLTGKILYRPPRLLLLIASSVLGGVYGVVSLFFGGNPVISMILHLFCAVIMCAVALGLDRELPKTTVLFYTVSLVIGGMMTAIFSTVNRVFRRTVFYNGTVVTLESDLSPGWFFVMAALAGFLTWGFGKVFRREIKKRRCEVWVGFSGREIRFSALADSGNLLTEPISGLPVVVVSYAVIEPLLPKNLCPVFREEKTELLPDLPFSVAKRVRLIPSRSIGSETILSALLPDAATVDGKPCRFCLAVSRQSGGDTSFGGCGGLLPISLAR